MKTQPMTWEEIEAWCFREMAAPIDSDMYARGAAILSLVRAMRATLASRDQWRMLCKRLVEVQPDDEERLFAEAREVIAAEEAATHQLEERKP